MVVGVWSAGVVGWEGVAVSSDEVGVVMPEPPTGGGEVVICEGKIWDGPY